MSQRLILGRVLAVLMPAFLSSRAAALPADAGGCASRLAAAEAHLHPSGPIDVFLIAGQSNATGVPDDAVGSPKVPHGIVLQYYRGCISDANDPVGNASPGSAWPEFGITYHQLTGHRVLLVPASMPASSLTRAGDFFAFGHWDATGRLFDRAVAAATQALRRAGPSARLAGILWDQGEADGLAINLGYETKSDFERSLVELVRRFRARLGADVPFLVFETGATNDKTQTGLEAVRNAEEAVSTSVPNAPLVFKDAVTFPRRGLMAKNGVHYSQAGYNEMGRQGALGAAAFLSRRAAAGQAP